MSYAITPGVFVSEARKWKGRPWLHLGRGWFGVDCVGFPLVLAHKFGLTDFETDTYARTENPRELRKMLRQLCVRSDAGKMTPAMLLEMSFGTQISHLAIVSDVTPLRIIHASSDHGQVVEHVLDKRYRSKVRGYYLIPGIQYD